MPILGPFVLSLSKDGRIPLIFKIKTNFVGGSPTASHFFLLRQRKSNQKEGDPGAPPLRGSLDISPTSGAAQLALAGHTKRAPLQSSNSARLNLRLFAKYRGGAQGKRNSRAVLCGHECPRFFLCKYVGRFAPNIQKLRVLIFRFFLPLFRHRVAEAGQGILTNMFEHVDA